MRFAIWGTGGMARAVRRSALESAAAHARIPVGSVELVFVDDNPERQAAPINGTRVISSEAVFREGDYLVNVSYADPSARRKTVEACREHGLRFFEIADSTTRRFDEVAVGEGAVFAANSLVTANVTIGDHFHCNIFSYVEHDCEIGDFVTFAPRVSCNGNVRIEDDVYVGSGAVIRQGSFQRKLTIGKGAFIGMGAVVTKDVAPGEIVIGVPARPIQNYVSDGK